LFGFSVHAAFSWKEGLLRNPKGKKYNEPEQPIGAMDSGFIRMANRKAICFNCLIAGGRGLPLLRHRRGVRPLANALPAQAAKVIQRRASRPLKMRGLPELIQAPATFYATVWRGE
jgi:hypothetical protein